MKMRKILLLPFRYYSQIKRRPSSLRLRSNTYYDSIIRSVSFTHQYSVFQRERPKTINWLYKLNYSSNQKDDITNSNINECFNCGKSLNLSEIKNNELRKKTNSKFIFNKNDEMDLDNHSNNYLCNDCLELFAKDLESPNDINSDKAGDKPNSNLKECLSCGKSLNSIENKINKLQQKIKSKFTFDENGDVELTIKSNKVLCENCRKLSTEYSGDDKIIENFDTVIKADKVVCFNCNKPLRIIKTTNNVYHYAMCDSCDTMYTMINKDILRSSLVMTNPDISQKEEKMFTTFSPKEIHINLDKFVMGQEVPKKILSVHIYSHYKYMLNATFRDSTEAEMNSHEYLNHFSRTKSGNKVQNITPLLGSGSSDTTARNGLISDINTTNTTQKIEDKVQLEKCNIILYGPTGTGKTLLAQTLARYLNVPFTICDCTTLTEVGYFGQDFEAVFHRLYQAANRELSRAEHGIVFLDEIDKIRTKPGLLRDIGGEGVQQSMLKLIEGSTINISDSKSSILHSSKPVVLNTKNILFIASGAFSGLENIVKKRKEKRKIGFIENKDNESILNDKRLVSTGNEDDDEINEKDMLLLEAETEDFVKYGLIPEFVGRFPVLAPVHGLTEDHLIRLMTHTKNSLLQQFKYFFDSENCKLTITDAAVKAIANRALSRGTGARGLRSILEKVLLNPRYEIPGSNIEEVIIDEESVTKGTPPIFVMKK